MRTVKEYTYRGLFIMLTILVSLLIHAALELPALHLVATEPERFAESWWWQHWELVHRTVNIILWVGGIGSGYLLGRYYWRVLYEHKRT